MSQKARKATPDKTPGRRPDIGPTPGMVTKLFDRVRFIKHQHPDLSRRIDGLETEIRDRLMTIKDTIDDFPPNERELITVLVINGVHRMCDEILIDDTKDDAE